MNRILESTVNYMSLMYYAKDVGPTPKSEGLFNIIQSGPTIQLKCAQMSREQNKGHTCLSPWCFGMFCTISNENIAQNVSSLINVNILMQQLISNYVLCMEFSPNY